MALKKNITRELVKYYDAHHIIEYIVCPAKAYITFYSEKVPVRQQVKNRLPKALNEIAITMLDGTTPEDPEKVIENVTSKVFEDIEYNKKSIDMKIIHELFLNFIRLVPEKELEIESLGRDFEIAYEGAIIQSRIDIICRDLKRGLKLPTIIDFSNTRYDPCYNPVVYRCQMVADYMELQNTNTEVLVLSISSGKQWVYHKKTYGDLLRASIEEIIKAINFDLFPVRFGWWCTGCYWKGICHLMLDVK